MHERVNFKIIINYSGVPKNEIGSSHKRLCHVKDVMSGIAQIKFRES